MLKTLIRLRLREVLIGRQKEGKKNNLSLSGPIGLFVMLIVIGIVFFGSVLLFLASQLLPVGAEWFFLILAFSMTILIVLFMTLTTAQGQLFQARDTENLLAMPIPSRYLLLSRMVALLILTYSCGTVILLPAGVAIIIFGTPTLLGTILYLVAFLLVPLIGLVFSLLFAYLIALILARTNHRNIVNVVVAFVGVSLYMGFYLNQQTIINKMVTEADRFGAAVKSWLFPLYLASKGIAEHDLLSFLGFAAIVIAAFGLAMFLVGRSFRTIATRGLGSAQVKYREKRASQQGPLHALTVLEFRRMLNSTALVLNSGFALLLLAGYPIYLLVSDGNGQFASFIIYAPSAAVPILFCIQLFFASMSHMAGAAITLDSKTLWISQTMPVDPKTILRAKIWLQVGAALPFLLVAAVLLQFVLPLNLAERIALGVGPLAIVIMTAYQCAYLALHHPRLDWVSETQAVKQGPANWLPLFSSLVLILGIGLFFFLFGTMCGPTWIALLLATLLLVGLAFFMRHRLMKKGPSLFCKLLDGSYDSK